MSTFHDEEGFNDAMYEQDVFRVYIFRRDIDAQVASWMKAARSGIWMKRMTEPYAQNLTITEESMIDCIKKADWLFLRHCDMRIAYEDLIAHWDASIGTILESAGWPIEKLPQAIEKQ